MKHRKTAVAIDGARFLVNGHPTYEGRTWKGYPIEGLLMNARMINGIFDDTLKKHPAKWNYRDSGSWDPDRNTAGFIAAMEQWRSKGLVSFTIGMQGGNPGLPNGSLEWRNSAFRADGTLDQAYMNRLGRVLDRADELGMVVILEYFYFGQEGWLTDDEAIFAATANATNWVLEKGYTNVLIEVMNECTSEVHIHHDLLKRYRVAEVIRKVKEVCAGRREIPVSVSFVHLPPTTEILGLVDFVLIHGNANHFPRSIYEIVDSIRANRNYRGQPIVNNEDDHFDFEKPLCNFTASIHKYVGWGYFDYAGYQAVPADWGVTGTPIKNGYWKLLAEVTGADRSGAEAGR